MGRPTGVTIIAVLYFLGTALCLLGGIGVMAGGGFVATLINQSGAQNAGAGAGIAAAIFGVLGVVLLVFGAIDLVVGIGLIKVKGWARIVAIVFSGIGVLFALPGLAMAFLHFSLVTLVVRVIVLAIHGWIIWYLLQPDVASAFQGGGRTVAASA